MAEESNRVKPRFPQPRTAHANLEVSRGAVETAEGGALHTDAAGPHACALDTSERQAPALQASALQASALQAPALQEWERALEDPEILAALYSPHYLRQCSTAADREGRIAELKRRIEACAYRIDCDRIAEELLLRGELSD